MTKLLTPETDPDHHTVGRYLKGFGVIWFCDSYDPSIGYWLTPVLGERNTLLDRPPERTNVSERAIDRTFHTIWRDDLDNKPYYSCRHQLTPEEKAFLAERTTR